MLSVVQFWGAAGHFLWVKRVLLNYHRICGSNLYFCGCNSQAHWARGIQGNTMCTNPKLEPAIPPPPCIIVHSLGLSTFLPTFFLLAVSLHHHSSVVGRQRGFAGSFTCLPNPSKGSLGQPNFPPVKQFTHNPTLSLKECIKAFSW